MSTVEQALESAILAALSADDAVAAVLGEPMRVLELESPKPTYPYFEIARHVSELAGSAGSEASDHRIDVAAISRLDAGRGSVAVIGEVREALLAAELSLDGWRCVLLPPVFVDTLRERVGLWRTVMRLRAVVEAV